MWSKGLFQCGAWPTLLAASLKKIHIAIMFIYKIIIGNDKARCINDDEIIAELDVLAPATIIRARRLCLFARACQMDFLAVSVRALQKVESSWAFACFADLKWLGMFPEFNECACWSVSQWVEHVAENPKGFRKSVLRLCSSRFASIVTSWAACESVSSIGNTLYCSICDKSFSNKQSTTLHEFKIHNIKAIERRYIDGTRCPVCLLEFWSSDRLLNHVKKCVVCHENLLMGPPLLTRAQADELDLAEVEAVARLKAKGLRRHAAEMSCVRAHGPLRLIVIDPCHASKHHPLGRGYQNR